MESKRRLTILPVIVGLALWVAFLAAAPIDFTQGVVCIHVGPWHQCFGTDDPNAPCPPPAPVKPKAVPKPTEPAPRSPRMPTV